MARAVDLEEGVALETHLRRSRSALIAEPTSLPACVYTALDRSKYALTPGTMRRVLEETDPILRSRGALNPTMQIAAIEMQPFIGTSPYASEGLRQMRDALLKLRALAKNYSG